MLDNIITVVHSKFCSVTDIFSTDKMKKQLVTVNRTSCLGGSWILMSCQRHRVTSGQFNTIISKFTFQNYSHTERATAPGGKIREETEEVNQTLSQVNPQNQSQHKHKTKHTSQFDTHKQQTNFQS